MSTSTFSNADTGSKPADPYTAKNRDNASVKEKVEDLASFIEACKFGMMTTRTSKNGLLTSRCMAVAGQESGGVDYIFSTNTESGKTDDLKSDPKVNLAFLNSSGEWASVSGNAEILTNRDVVKKYYSRSLKAWLGDLGDGKHDGGPEDPRIGIIKVSTITATHAAVRRTAVGRGVEIAKGAVTGDVPDITKLRELSEQEISEYRRLAT